MAGELNATSVVMQVGDGATTEVFAAIPGIVGVPSFPALVSDDIEVSALDSAAKEFIIGLGDAGNTEFQLNLRKKASGSGYIAIQAQLEGYANDGLPHNFKLIVNFGVTMIRTYSWAAFVKSFVPGAPGVNSQVTASVTLRNTGAVVRT